MSPPSLTFANRFLEERRKAACNRVFNNNNEAIKPRPCPCIRIRIHTEGQRGCRDALRKNFYSTANRIPDVARVANCKEERGESIERFATPHLFSTRVYPR